MKKKLLIILLMIANFGFNAIKVEASAVGCIWQEMVLDTYFADYKSDPVGEYIRDINAPFYDTTYGSLDIAHDWREQYLTAEQRKMDESLAWRFAEESRAVNYYNDLKNNLHGKYIIDKENKTIKYLQMFRIVTWGASGGLWHYQSEMSHITWDYDIEKLELDERLTPLQNVKFLTKKFSVDEMFNNLEENVGEEISKVVFDSSSIQLIDEKHLDKFQIEFKKNPTSDPIDVLKAKTVSQFAVTDMIVYAYGTEIEDLASYSFALEFNGRLKTNFFSGDKTTTLASGTGMNIKHAGQICMTMGMQFFILLSGEATYELKNDDSDDVDVCDPDIAQDPEADGFDEYWTTVNGVNGVEFIPTEEAMRCNCATNADGSFKYPEFHEQLTGSSSAGYYNGPDDYETEELRYPPLNLTCEHGGGNENQCVIGDRDSYTPAKIQECCDEKAPGFDEKVCPVSDSEFNLFCDNNVTGNKTYSSVKDELPRNDLCTITCNEEGYVRFDESPFAVAGQGFAYDWDLTSHMSCNAEYNQTTAEWASDYNKAVEKMVDKYDDYMIYKEIYEDYRDNVCQDTYKDTKCSKNYVLEIDPLTNEQTSVWDGTYDSCPRCSDTDMKVSTYEDKLGDKEDDMDDAERAYVTAEGLVDKLLKEKNQCDGFNINYNTTGDFDLKIEENGYKTFPMKETVSEDPIFAFDEFQTDSTKKILYKNCKTTRDLGNCDKESIIIYDNWVKKGKYEFTFEFPENIYIDRATGIDSTSITDNYYSGGNKYFTDLGTLTNDYDLDVIEKSDGFGYWEQWNLANKKMPCWYDLSNRLGPSAKDSNYEIYGNIGIEFRVVNLDDLFPGREPKSNWENEDNLIDNIEETGDSIYTESEPIYKIILTPDAMKDVRDYLDQHNYSDWYDFEFESNQRGTSGFLDNLDEYNIQMETTKPNTYYNQY